MSLSQFAASSSSKVASQLSLSSETSSYDFTKRSSVTESYPFTQFPNHGWDVQNLENDQHTDDDELSSSAPTTPGLIWDSRPSSSEISGKDLKSVFEDWDSDPSSDVSVIFEDDGAQTLVISPESPFFHSPPTPCPFDYEPFSKSFCDNDKAFVFQNDAFSGKKSEPDVGREQRHQDKPIKKQELFIDFLAFSPLGQTGFTLGSEVYHCPILSDDAKFWVEKEDLQLPDVPRDCIYTADDLASPFEQEDENSWSLCRSSPCN